MCPRLEDVLPLMKVYSFTNCAKVHMSHYNVTVFVCVIPYKQTPIHWRVTLPSLSVHMLGDTQTVRSIIISQTKQFIGNAVSSEVVMSAGAAAQRRCQRCLSASSVQAHRNLQGLSSFMRMLNSNNEQGMNIVNLL